jgi:hypothetical protein
MIPRVKPEDMLFGRPVPTFPDHALSQIFRSNGLPVPQPRVGRGDMRQRESLFLCRWGPAESRVLHPLPTCQNEGYSRVITSPTRRHAWLTRGYQRGIWLPEMQVERRVRRVPVPTNASSVILRCERSEPRRMGGPAGGRRPSRRPLRSLLRVTDYKYGFTFSRRGAPGVLQENLALEIRGRREDRVLAAPAVSCAVDATRCCT